jgi:hypothetical protein
MYARPTRSQNSPNTSSQLDEALAEPLAYGREGPVEVLRYFWLDNMILAHYSSLYHHYQTGIRPITPLSSVFLIPSLQHDFLDGPQQSADNITQRP